MLAKPLNAFFPGQGRIPFQVLRICDRAIFGCEHGHRNAVGQLEVVPVFVQSDPESGHVHRDDESFETGGCIGLSTVGSFSPSM